MLNPDLFPTGRPYPSVGFRTAPRLHSSLTAAAEKRLLEWMARHAPPRLTPDHLTILGLGAQVGAGACYALARVHRAALLGVVLCIAANWLGDSLDGTLARVRNRQRPRYGFYVDHVVDLLGTAALMGGLACSGLLHPAVALALLAGFLLLSGESYLATYTLGRFELSQGLLGPTELRLLLILGTLALLRSPFATLFGHRWLLLDLGGVLAAGCMALLAIRLSLGHAAQLRGQEPLP